MVTTEFQETPLTSSYLIAFIISDFDTVSCATNRIPQRVFSRPNAIQFTDFALSNGIKILSAMENYLGLEYSLPKMDQIAIPDFSAAAMENWGIVTYR